MFFAKYALGRTDDFNSDKEQRYLYNNLVNKQLDSWHPRCAQIVRAYLPTKTYKNVVDIGCCGGSTLEFLGVSGEKITLIDIAERQLEVAKEKARKRFNQIESIHSDLSLNPKVVLQSAPYDLVINSHSVQHIHNLESAQKVISYSIDSLKKGGLLYFACYRYNRFWPSMRKRSGFFQNVRNGPRIFFRRYTLNEVRDMFTSLTCILLRRVYTDIVYLGEKK